MRHLLVLLAVLWCAPAWALNLPDPMPDHPRLLINQAMIDSAQSRIAVVGSDHARIYAAARRGETPDWPALEEELRPRTGLRRRPEGPCTG